MHHIIVAVGCIGTLANGQSSFGILVGGCVQQGN
jgi:hypothetical protein